MLNKKGFTLVELLGVFVILGIIALVTLPYASGMLKNTKDSEYERFEENVFLATEAYIEANSDDYLELKTNGGITFVSFDELVDNGFISDKLVNPNTNKKIDLNNSIKITKNSEGFDYEILDKNYSTSAYVQNGLIAHYDGYKAPYTLGGNQYWKDISGNNNNGLLNNFDSTSGWQMDHMYLDGTNDYIDLGMNGYDFESNVTFEILVKVDSTKTYAQHLFGNVESGGGGFYFNTSSQFAFQMYVDAFSAYKGAFSDASTVGTWYHIVGTYDGTNVKIYRNGSVKTNSNAAGTSKASPVNIIIGANPGTSSNSGYSNISVRRAAIYNRTLTQTEVQQNYQLDKLRFGI